jgi:molybdate transport system substrate-binding protein
VRAASLLAILPLSVLLSVRGTVALAGEPLTVSAAVSLKETLSAATRTIEAQTGDSPQFNFGATGHLLAQIRDGAPVDVFIAASAEQMDQAETQKLIDPTTRVAIAGNEMVLIVPAPSTATPIREFADVAGPAVHRLAIGQPKTVPAGVYATQVLERLKLTSAVADRIVYGSSVRQVLDYVARGEVDAGIVYATDAREAGETVRVVATAQPQWHDPIRYVAAVVASSKKPAAARRFVETLGSDAVQRVLRDRGFTPVPSTQPANHSS